MPIPCYRIKNWEENYENNRTRSLKNMLWLPLPVKLSGDGYTLTMAEKDGLMLFGGFIVLLEIAAQCNPRGTFINKDKIPHDHATLVRLSRMQPAPCKKVLDFHLNKTKWLEMFDLESGAVIPQEPGTNPAVIPHEGALQEGSTGSTKQVGNTYKRFSHLKLLIKDFERLKENGFTKEQIDTILLKIENYSRNTKYKSLYLTSLDWLKREYPEEKKLW